MAKPNLMEALTPEQRAKMKKSDFIFPDRRDYPIPDEEHAMDALTFARWPKNKKDFKQVLAAVKKRYPGVVKRFMGGRFAKKQEAVKLGDKPELRERLEAVGALIAEADDLKSVDPNSVTGMFMQEQRDRKQKRKRKRDKSCQ